MGVIGVLGPFVVQMAAGDQSIAFWLVGAVISGAAFGDNLSLVSDTSIAASQTVGVTPKQKFAENAKIALWASLAVVLIYLVCSYLGYAPNVDVGNSESQVVFWKLLPYVAIIVVALLGAPVVIALFGTTVFAALLGLFFGDYTLEGFAQDLKNGFFEMTEVAILSFCLGGLQAFVIRNGGIDKVARQYKSQRRASWVIAKFSFITDVIFANNTVSILFAGSTVKKIAENNKVPLAFSASLMDVFATASQCIIPHGAQMLLASSFLGCSPLEIMPYCLYSFALYVCGVWSIYKRG